MRLTTLTLAIACSGSALFLTACGNDDYPQAAQQPTPQFYLSERNYSLDTMADASAIKIMNYKMPSVTGELTDTSALVFFPKTPQPKDGYRVVVWEHGTLGVADKCAPTVNPLNGNFKSSTAENLLKAGYVVVAPDYEGLGGKNIHPYLNLHSEANSAIYAVKAAQEHYWGQLNPAWMSVGQSQGGQASLGTAQYANTDVNYKGAVAGAPASSLGTIILDVAPTAINNLPVQVAIPTYATLLSYAAMAGAGITAYQPSFDYRAIFASTSAKQIAEKVETECLDGVVAAYSADISQFLAANPTKKVSDYAGIDTEAFKNNATIKDFLTNVSQPTTKQLSKPILIIQGTNDTNVPYVVTDTLYKAMAASGTNVSLLPVVGAGHTQAIIQENGSMLKFVQSQMPAQ